MGYKTAEADLTDQVVDYLELLHMRGVPIYWEHRSGSGGFSYKKGTPDFFVVIRGLHIECELKAPHGKLSTMQEKFKWRCETEWEMLYVCPKSIEEFIKFIEPLL